MSQKIHGKLFLASLAIAVFSAWLITVTFQLLLIDVARTFNVEVGTASFIAVVGSIAGIITGLLLSLLTVRFNHKSLLLVGIAFLIVSVVGFYVAPTFALFLLPHIAFGIGLAMTGALAYTLIGEFYPLEKRGKAVGAMVASSTLAYVIGGPINALIANVGTWRTSLLWFVFPVSTASLILAWLVVPKKSAAKLPAQKEPFLAGCKQAFSRSSPAAALFVTMFVFAEASIGIYLISFFRTQFAIDIGLGSLVMLVGNLLSAIGGIVAGLMINRVGRKPLGTVASLIAALLTLTFTFMPTFPLSWGLNAVRFWFAGMAFTAGGSLVLEQVPKYRGTMMSLNSAFMNAGMMVAALAGGIAINLYNYQTMAVVLGSLGLLGAVIWISLVKDPSRTQAPVPST